MHAMPEHLGHVILQIILSYALSGSHEVLHMPWPAQTRWKDAYIEYELPVCDTEMKAKPKAGVFRKHRNKSLASMQARQTCMTTLTVVNCVITGTARLMAFHSKISLYYKRGIEYHKPLRTLRPCWLQHPHVLSWSTRSDNLFLVFYYHWISGLHLYAEVQLVVSRHPWEWSSARTLEESCILDEVEMSKWLQICDCGCGMNWGRLRDI